MERDPDASPARGFPRTRHSAVAAAASDDPAERRRALETLVALYWRPVYVYLRLHWRAPVEEAEDLTQGFFVGVLEKDTFARFDRERARFRTFLRTCLDGFVSNERKAAGRFKRGGAERVLSLDFRSAEGDLERLEPPAPDGGGAEGLFRREWVRSLFGLALARLEQELCGSDREAAWRLFDRYDLQSQEPGPRPSYADLAAAEGLSVTQVTNRLASVRRRFRQIALEELRRTTADEDEFRAEARGLFGDAP